MRSVHTNNGGQKCNLRRFTGTSVGLKQVPLDEVTWTGPTCVKEENSLGTTKQQNRDICDRWVSVVAEACGLNERSSWWTEQARGRESRQTSWYPGLSSSRMLSSNSVTCYRIKEAANMMLWLKLSNVRLTWSLHLLKISPQTFGLFGTPSDGFTGPIPQPEGPLFASGCRPSLPVGYGMCCDCHGDPQCRFQRLSRRVLHGGMVLLLRDDGGGVLPGRHPSPQLPACVLGKPHSHMCGLCNTPVSQVFAEL